MRAAMPGMVLAMVLICVTVLTVIVSVIGLGMIIYHTVKQPFEKRPMEKIRKWVNAIMLTLAVAVFMAIIAFAYGCI